MRIYWGYNPLILTIDPNFQRDIQEGVVISVYQFLEDLRKHLSRKCGETLSRRLTTFGAFFWNLLSLKPTVRLRKQAFCPKWQVLFEPWIFGGYV